MGYDQYTTVAVKHTFVALLSTHQHTSMTSRAILSNFFFVKKSELKTTQNTFRDCRVYVFPTTFLEIAQSLYTWEVMREIGLT